MAHLTVANEADMKIFGRFHMGLHSGFTLMEMIVICAILALLATLAVPAFMKIVPGFRVKTEASHVATVMRQARLKAANVQRPTRVVVDCRDHVAAPVSAPVPCMVNMYTAQYSGGVFDSWREVEGTRHAMHTQVLFINKPGGAATDLTNIFWAIFMPSSRVVSSHDPMTMVFVSEALNKDPARVSWEVNLNNGSGRTVLLRAH